jgi:polyhydroxyalkanoate synthesis repressor PhaR
MADPSRAQRDMSSGMLRGNIRVDRRRPDRYVPSMSEPIVLKKYGNRRLYDTNESRYVTLAEVAAMLQRGDDMRVVDAKTGEDLTKEILVQIILEREGAREILPTSFLKQIVRVAGSPWKESFASAVQQSVHNLVDGQRAALDAQKQLVSQVAQMAPTMWNPFAAFGGPPPSQQQQQRDPEFDRMRAELNETQSLLRRLIQQGDGASGPKAAPRKKKAIVRRNKKA